MQMNYNFAQQMEFATKLRAIVFLPEFDEALRAIEFLATVHGWNSETHTFTPCKNGVVQIFGRPFDDSSFLFAAMQDSLDIIHNEIDFVEFRILAELEEMLREFARVDDQNCQY